MSDQWDIEVDGAVCMASGLCRGTRPDLFVAGDDRKTVVTQPRVNADESVLDAAATCPVEAITVTDAVTGEVVDPEM